MDQLETLEERVHANLERKFAGGTMYGVDWPTLWAVYPHLASRLRQIKLAQLKQLQATK
jgi:hypothetical protein